MSVQVQKDQFVSFTECSPTKTIIPAKCFRFVKVNVGKWFYVLRSVWFLGQKSINASPKMQEIHI